MKYARNEEHIFECETPNEEWYVENKGYKFGDSIEELCDEFVTKVEHPNPHGTKPHGHYMNAMLFKDIVKYYLSSIEVKGKTYDVYAAIWTEWGLKYVAKLNDKGELELL